MTEHSWFDDWVEGDIETLPPIAPFFERKVDNFLSSVMIASGAEAGYCAVSGFEPGRFVPISITGNLARETAQADLDAEMIAIRGRSTLPEARTDHRAWFVPIVGQQELYGFAKALSPRKASLSRLQLDDWQRDLKDLSDHNYTRRVQVLSEPFQFNTGDDIATKDAVENQITRFAALSFGADGVILRRYIPDVDVLKVTQFQGEFNEMLLEDRSRGQSLSGGVLNDPKFGWSVLELATGTSMRGCKFDEDTIRNLKEWGIKAAVCARLDNPLGDDEPPFGTLTYFYERPSRISWRDVTLFFGFCKRAADALALRQGSTDLKSRDEAIQNYSSEIAQAEVASLLVHDLGHRIFHVEAETKKLESIVVRQIRNYRAQVPVEVTAAAQRIEHATKELQHQVAKLRLFGPGALAENEIRLEEFSLHGLVADLFTTMRDPLERSGLSSRNSVPRDIRIRGFKTALYQVLLTLLLNSIDAVKASKRSAEVEIVASADRPDFVMITFSDTGPGLNLSLLDKPDAIFSIGVTTKPGGTGLGLPLARNLVSKWFQGSMDLGDRKKAVFKIGIRRIND